MAGFTSVALFIVLRFFAIIMSSSQSAGAAPTNATQPTGAASTYWISQIERRGIVAFGDPGHKVYRNVRDFGAKGDGTTDDSDAINSAISQGSRCGQGCDSSTTTPALVYFPPGTYMVSKPLIQLYYTQFVGDAINIPVLKASANFKGMAVIDADPYGDGGANWYTNQNNFFRQVRNFVIDLTAMPPTAGAGIHWQVAQATSLQNIRFEMVKGGDNNKQQGIFMDNGSGGFMTDLTFNGGNYGMFLGNQQFTTRNLTFNDCNTAIYMNWNWLWTFKSLSINRCKIGVDMGALVQGSDNNQTVGSVLIQDSMIADTPIGVNTSYVTGKNVPVGGGTLVIDNVHFSKCPDAVVGPGKKTVLKGDSLIASWAQGHAYSTGSLSGSSPATPASPSTQGVVAGSNGTCSATTKSRGKVSAFEVQKPFSPVKKPASLLDKSGKVVERAKPQYETVPVTSFISVKAQGAKGDGKTDDTAALQKIFDTADSNSIIYFDHGSYIVTDTIKVPANRKITGEIWPIIMAHGPAFGDQKNPKPLFQVGKSGETGSVEISDLVFSTKGASPGAILVEWNLAEPKDRQGSSGMWDTHFRLGGFAGTDLQSDTCAKNPNITTTAASVQKCSAAFLSLHVTKQAGIYLENTWFWTADHELDRKDHSQINIYSGRGVLIESQGQSGVWLYGTSAEHSQLYNYQISNAKNVYMAAIQTETPYMQANPDALSGGFTPQPKYSDPDFSTCTGPGCKKAWGLRVINSQDIFVYGAGLYSFFDNYSQDCLKTESCQKNMLEVRCSNGVRVWGLSTKASENMVTREGEGVVKQADNRSNFCSTVALFEEV